MHSAHPYQTLFIKSRSMLFLSSALFGSIGSLINFQMALFTEELVKLSISSFLSSSLFIIPYLLASQAISNKIAELQLINPNYSNIITLQLCDILMVLTLPFSSSLFASVLFNEMFATVLFSELLGLGTVFAVNLATRAFFSILERHQNKSNLCNSITLCTNNEIKIN